MKASDPNRKVLVKVSAESAEAVCQVYKVPEEVAKLLESNPTPLSFLDNLLADEELEHHAVDFLAHALPKREAVWWSCLGAWCLGGPSLPPAHQAALKAAVRWVLEPNETHRQATEPVAEHAGYDTPAGCLARAVFESGGSLLAPGQPVVEPGPTLTAQGISGAVHLLALGVGPDKMQLSYRTLIALGLGVAMGQYPWAVPRQRPSSGVRWSV